MAGKYRHLARRPRWADFKRFAALLAIGGVLWAMPAFSTTARAVPTIEVAAEIVVVSSVVTPLQIKVSRADALTHQAIMIIRGLPARVTLTEGRSFSPGVWAIPLSAVGRIEMVSAHDINGRSDLTIELVALDGKVLANAASTLYIMPPGVMQDKVPSASADGKNKGNSIALTVGPLGGKPDLPATSTQTPASLTPRLTAAEIETARNMTRKGDENMQAGKIAAARLFYKSAAESGYAPAALALGATYDSRQLARLKVVGGEQADPAMARTWYEKARELGAPEAERRLQALELQ